MAADGPPSVLFVGLTTLDVVHRTDRRPGPNEKVIDDAVARACGAATRRVQSTGAHRWLSDLDRWW